MIKISPSILAADPLHMERDIRRVVDAGCDWLHVDIMDAHFVPNLSFSPALTKALHKAFPDVPLDVHLMMDQPGRYLDAFLDAGAAGITIHAEIDGDISAMLQAIRVRGAWSGLSVKPGTPVETIRPLLPLCDLVLVMTVEPGFGGQSFMAEQADKVGALRAMGYTGLIEADGGISPTNLSVLAKQGLDVAVMGTALFKADDPAQVVRDTHDCVM